MTDDPQKRGAAAPGPSGSSDAPPAKVLSVPIVAPVISERAARISKAPGSLDDRSARRFPFEINVDIVSEHNFYAGLSLNISEGGLFVATHVEYPVGTKLEIRLLLPGDEEPTSIQTEVRWVRPHNENADGSAGMGLRFLNLSPAVLDKVSRFAKSRDPLYYEDD
ncbi:MAG: TIGR02266 family protein [Polyangiaceae bacterium]